MNFISAYYNHNKYPIKEKLAKEFVLRYPEVCMIELAFDDEPFVINAKNTLQIRTKFKGFVNNECINYYIKLFPDLEFLVFIDSDLILFPDFFEKIKIRMASEKGPLFLQPFSTCVEKYDDPKIMSNSLFSSAYHFKNFGKFSFKSHSGYIYGFNKQFIQLFEKLPESLLLGSWDTFLWLCLTNQAKQIKLLMPNSEILEEILKFEEKCDDVEIDFIEGCIAHNFHGNKILRYSGRLELYKNINEKVIEEYFLKRSES